MQLDAVPILLDPSFRKSDETFPTVILLIDDQPIIAEAIRRLLADESDMAFHYCQDAQKALHVAAEVKPTVILQDLIMPEVDGLMLVRQFRANPTMRDIPLVVLSSREDPKVKAEAFSLGANDYMVKIPKKEEFIARVRYHSKNYVRLLERNIAYKKLEQSQRALTSELSEAAEYVKSLLPKPLSETIQTNWQFIPSTQLGGDAFGYNWLDPDHFAFYLLDVCGHGVGAALLSISVVNVLRSQTLPNTDFHDPSHVLKSLNEAFPMEKNNQMFFTIWYGVFNKKNREIVFASGGHPPAILITGDSPANAKTKLLTTDGMIVGGMEDANFPKDSCKVGPYNKVFVFSDGVFEINRPDGSIMHYNDFVQILESSLGLVAEQDIDRIVQKVRVFNGPGPFADDFSILEITF